MPPPSRVVPSGVAAVERAAVERAAVRRTRQMLLAGLAGVAAIGGQVCANTSSTAADAPLRILIAHEQHLQPMGCDVRLLGIIRGLLAAGLEVSLFFRSHTPVAKRWPRTETLATLLRIPRGYNEEWLRADVRSLPPPAIYEHRGTRHLARLFAEGWFHAVLVFFWFWHDPKPNVAELLLPPLHAFSPRGRRPFVAILSDDAHAIRDERLASWESHPGLRANFSRRAVQHAQREASAYAFADLLLHITAADGAAEREQFPFVHRCGFLRLAPSLHLSHLHACSALMDPCTVRGACMHASACMQCTHGSVHCCAWYRFGLLRLSLADTDTASAGGGVGGGGGRGASLAPSRELLSHEPVHIGFLGNGQTPTNHLAVQWFVSSCWAELRSRTLTVLTRPATSHPIPSHPMSNHSITRTRARTMPCAVRAGRPTARLRLVGMKPGYRLSAESREVPCNATADLHCGWAWGTPYASEERSHGIDELGFVDEMGLEAEMRRWKMMIVPVLQTTGVNTKVTRANLASIHLASIAQTKPQSTKPQSATPRSKHRLRHTGSPPLPNTVSAPPTYPLPYLTGSKVYAALRLGLPIVITRAAAAPFELPADGTAALLADDASSFTAAVDSLLGSPDERARLGAAARRHWERLVAADRSSSDLLQLVE